MAQLASRGGRGEECLDFPAGRTCVLDEMPPEDVVGQVALQIGQVSQERLRRWRQIRHAGRIRAQRGQRTAPGGPKCNEDRTGASGEALGQRHQQGSFAAEPLHEPARSDAGLVSDVGQSELVRPASAHGALGGCEDVFVGNLLASSGHRLLTITKRPFSLSLIINLAQEAGMRKVVYGGAMSLDAFIAGPNGEYDWIVMDPDIDFAALMARFDTFLIGRKTFEVMRRMGDAAPPAPGIQNIVFSRTLRAEDCPQAILSDDADRVVTDLRSKPGKDIALFGGGELFRSLLAAGLVDEISLSVIPVLLGGGIPLLPSPADRARLKLKKHRIYEKTGTVGLEYDIVPK